MNTSVLQMCGWLKCSAVSRPGILLGQLIHCHKRALRGQADRSRLPDAGRRASDQRGLAIEAPLHDSSSQ
jgi:hypothetical protein